jgi:hypothetical protein
MWFTPENEVAWSRIASFQFFLWVFSCYVLSRKLTDVAASFEIPSKKEKLIIIPGLKTR